MKACVLVALVFLLWKAAAEEQTIESVIQERLDAAELAQPRWKSSWKRLVNLYVEDVKSLMDLEVYNITELMSNSVRDVIDRTLPCFENPTAEDLENNLQEVTKLIKSVPVNRHSLPVTRRLILALAVKFHLSGQEWTPQLRQLFISLSASLYKIHRSGIETKGVLEFFHVSKSGGTSLCSLGGTNKCSTQYFDIKHNCLIRYFNDMPRWTVREVLDIPAGPWCANYGRRRRTISCSGRLRYLRFNNWNFYSNEYVVLGGVKSYKGAHLCREFAHVVIFREPEARLVSHMNNVLREYQSKYGEQFYEYFNPHNAEQWHVLAPAVVNNYYTRSLLGENTYLEPFGYINSTHLQAARQVTAQFDVIMILEDKETNTLMFQVGLGWNTTLDKVHARQSTSKSTRMHLHSDLESLAEMNALDQELYQYAFLLQLLDAVGFDVVKYAIETEKARTVSATSAFGCGYVGRSAQQKIKILNDSQFAVVMSPPPPKEAKLFGLFGL